MLTSLGVEKSKRKNQVAKIHKINQKNQIKRRRKVIRNLRKKGIDHRHQVVKAHHRHHQIQNKKAKIAIKRVRHRNKKMYSKKLIIY